MEIFLVDAFTDKRFEGNRAGVVLDAASLSREEKLQIASEINASETAFLIRSEPGTKSGANIKQADSTEYTLEYFTPTTEVDFCGHATVALFHTLATTGVLKVDDAAAPAQSVAKTKAGRFDVAVSRSNHSFQVKLTHAQKPQFKKIKESAREVAEALKVRVEDLSEQLPFCLAKTANWHLVIGLVSKEVLDGISYDVQRLSALLSEYDAVTAHVFCKDVAVPGRFYVRNFGPSVGIPEDPATGSAAGAFGAYLFHENLLANGENRVSLIQGEAMKRRSAIEIEFVREGAELKSVEVVGTAVQSFKLVPSR